jgi:hypothetical protein
MSETPCILCPYLLTRHMAHKLQFSTVSFSFKNRTMVRPNVVKHSCNNESNKTIFCVHTPCQREKCRSHKTLSEGQVAKVLHKQSEVCRVGFRLIR